MQIYLKSILILFVVFWGAPGLALAADAGQVTPDSHDHATGNGRTKTDLEDFFCVGVGAIRNETACPQH